MKPTNILLTAQSLPRATHISSHAHAPPGLLGGTYQALTKTSSSDRSVHIKVHPRPRSLAESAQLLGILRSYGEIEVFRHLKYDFDAPAPNSLLVVFKHAASAARLVAEDKVAFRYGSASDKPASASGKDEGKPNGEGEGEELLYSHTAPFPRPGAMVAQRAGLLHLPHIQRQRYYWPVDVPSDAGRPGTALLGKLPPGLDGMRDFDVMRPETSFRAREGWSRAWDERVRERGWITLRELWEKGNREKKMEREKKTVQDGERQRVDEIGGG